MAPNVGLETKSICYLRAQRLRKAMLAAIYIYPVYVEYRRKFGVQIPKTPVSTHSDSLCLFVIHVSDRTPKVS